MSRRGFWRVCGSASRCLPSRQRSSGGLSSGRARVAGGSVPREGRGSECGCHLPLKEEQSEDFPVPLDMEDIVKVVGWLRPFERVLQRTAEQAVYLDRVDECNSRSSSGRWT